LVKATVWEHDGGKCYSWSGNSWQPLKWEHREAIFFFSKLVLAISKLSSFQFGRGSKSDRESFRKEKNGTLFDWRLWAWESWNWLARSRTSCWLVGYCSRPCLIHLSWMMESPYFEPNADCGLAS
jgi:hypothetical protein